MALVFHIRGDNALLRLVLVVKYELSVYLGTLIYSYLLSENMEYQHCPLITQSFITGLKLTG